MSYILDALKKSEEERHQGQVPSLGGNSTLIHSSGNKTAVWPWIIAALLLLNMLVIAYWLIIGNKDAKMTDAPLEAFVEDRPVSVTSEREYAAAYEYTAPKVQSREPLVSYPQNNLRVDPVINTDAKAISPEYVLAETLPPKAELPKTSDIESNVIKLKESSPTVASIDPPAQPQNDFIDEEPMLITPKSGARPYNGPSYDEEVEDVSIDEPDVSSVRHASDFPQSFQRRIPDMAFNSHIYTDTPDSRRVMINNIYLREGQVFSGLTVVQITEEGVVLSLDGQAFKVGVLRDWSSPR